MELLLLQIGMLTPHYNLAVFPDLKDAPAVEVNLNDLALRLNSVRNDLLARDLSRIEDDASRDHLCAAYAEAGKRSPLLNAPLADMFLWDLHKTLGAEISFGDYLKDRGVAWHGSYLEKDKAIHLGIDVNAPAGTAVAVTRDCWLAKIVNDPDQDGGWGTALVFKLDEPIGDTTHFIYAHLAKDSVTMKVGDHAKAGQTVAALGDHHENGGWYAHLHVQALTEDASEQVLKFEGLSAIDGYDSMPANGVHPLSPDPTPLLSLQP